MRILLFHPGALGDLILALPAIERLRADYPDARIVGFARSGVWRYSKSNVEVVDLETSGIHRVFSAADRGVTGSADLVITWMGHKDGEFIKNLEESTGGRVIACAPNPPHNNTQHISRYIMDSLESASAFTSSGYPPFKGPWLAPDEDGDRAAETILAKIGVDDASRLLMIHPGAGSRSKRGPAASFAGAARMWIDSGMPAVLLEGPADEEASSDVLKEIDLPVLKNKPIGTLISIFSKGAVYLGNDSGITHLAAASGASVVALFGPTDPRVWGPLGRRAAVISANAHCAPCEREKWSSCTDDTCMSSISIGEIRETLGGFVN